MTSTTIFEVEMVTLSRHIFEKKVLAPFSIVSGD